MFSNKNNKNSVLGKIGAMAVLVACMGPLSGEVYANAEPFLAVDPIEGTTYGRGYDSRSKTFSSKICIEFDPNDTVDVDTTVGVQEQFSFNENTADITDMMNLSLETNMEALTTAGAVEASNTVGVLSRSNTSSLNQSLFASINQYLPSPFLRLDNARIKPEYLAMLDRPGGENAFRRECGDAFVIGLTPGRQMLGVASINNQTIGMWNDLTTATSLDITGATWEVGVDVDTLNTMESIIGSNNITIDVSTTGSTSNVSPTSLTELRTYYQNFIPGGGPSRTMKMVLAPYNTMPNYALGNPLKEITKDDYIYGMVEALWNLKEAVADADYVLDQTTQEMFALGMRWDTAGRRQRLAAIEKQRYQWNQEFDFLRNAARTCNDNFNDMCRKLGLFYLEDRNLDTETYVLLPQRYLSDCYSRISLTPTALGQFKTVISGKKLDHVAGDQENSGNTMRVVAVLAFEKDGRKLLGRLSVAAIEWKRKDFYKHLIEVRTNKGESGWAMEAVAPVMDLDKPDKYGFFGPDAVNTKYCAWNRNFEGAAGSGWPVVAENRFRGYGFNTQSMSPSDLRPYVGYIDGKSAKRPRGQVYFGGGDGLLDYITCEVDTPTSDEGKLRCEEVGFKDIQLKLVSIQDIDAANMSIPAVSGIPGILLQTKDMQLKASNLARVGPATRVAPQQPQVSMATRPGSVQAQKAPMTTMYVPAVAQKKSIELDNRMRAYKHRNKSKVTEVTYKIPRSQKALMQKRMKANAALASKRQQGGQPSYQRAPVKMQPVQPSPQQQQKPVFKKPVPQGQPQQQPRIYYMPKPNTGTATQQPATTQQSIKVQPRVYTPAQKPDAELQQPQYKVVPQ